MGDAVWDRTVLESPVLVGDVIVGRNDEAVGLWDDDDTEKIGEARVL